MKKLALVIIAALGLVLAAPARGQATTALTIEQMPAYVAAMAKIVNGLTAKSKAQQALIEQLRNDLDGTTNYALNVGLNYDRLLRAMILNICYTNLKVPTWGGILIGLQVYPLGNHTCPTEPPPWTWQVPQYSATNGEADVTPQVTPTVP